MKAYSRKFSLSLIAMAVSTASFAAQPVDLSDTPLTTLQSSLLSTSQGSSGFKQTSTHVDANQTSHIRVQQTYAGFPVWGADAVIHAKGAAAHSDVTALLAHPTPNTWMNGTAYRDLVTDLTIAPERAFSSQNSANAMKKAISIATQKSGHGTIIHNQHIRGIVFVDKDNKAHWAWYISFQTSAPHQPRAIPTFIMDATSFQIDEYWNNLQTTTATLGGGYGGNGNMGKLVFDGLKNDLPALSIDRNASTKTCSLKNDEVTVLDRHSKSVDDTISTFRCGKLAKQHNRTYWDGSLKAKNCGYSPDNDALFIGHVVQKLYKEWYGIPALKQDDGSPMMLTMRVHDFENPDNAFWDGTQMTFSDGDQTMFYPFTILNIGAHEISHGFTEQHANLAYEHQSGGLNESFSDMAGAAADFYAYGKSSWQLGAEISKTGGKPFRYMDKPSKDCGNAKPGQFCSIDNARQFKKGVDWHCDWTNDPFCMNPVKGELDVHHSSGVFNRAFYLLATTQGWDIHKAFDVMLKANQDYWVSTSSFKQAACGVKNAAIDLKYDTKAVTTALLTVGLDTKKCKHK